MTAPRYFIQHFKASRPYYRREFTRALIDASSQGHSAVNPVIFNGIEKATSAAGVPASQLMEHNFLSNEVAAVQCMAQLEMDGFPLYDIEPTLLEALAHSDVGDMCLEDLRAPNRAYYLHWGPQDGLKLHGKYPVEGAFVFCHHEDWRVGLVARTDHPWMLAPQRDVFQLRFPAACRSLPFDQAVDLALQCDTQDLAATARQIQDAAPERLRLIAEIRGELEANTPVLKEALRLAGNCFAYLTAYPEDSRFDWAPDTPVSMQAKLQRGGKERERTASKLNAMGFFQVHKVGLDFLQAAERAHQAQVSSGRSVEPHWRRGHWRHQAYGEKLSLRKLIWMRPMRVLGGPVLVDEGSAGTSSAR